MLHKYIFLKNFIIPKNTANKDQIEFLDFDRLWLGFQIAVRDVLLFNISMLLVILRARSLWGTVLNTV